MNPTARDARPLTGRRVALIALAAFAVMLTPNIILAVKAVETFSGLVVPNSYVASQNFDRDRTAQQALGWTVTLDQADGVLHPADRRRRTAGPSVPRRSR